MGMRAEWSGNTVKKSDGKKIDWTLMDMVCAMLEHKDFD